MSTTTEDERIGVPVRGAKPFASLSPPPAPPAQPSPVSEPTLRAGETDLGRPSHIPDTLNELSDDDRRRLREAEEEQALRDLAEAEEMMVSDPVVRWVGWFAHPLAAAFLLGSAGALGLFLYSQVLTILSNIATQPEWVQYLGYAGLFICGGAVLFAAIRLLVLYVSLRRNRQIRIAGLAELNKRTKLRWLAHAKSTEARNQLERYLREFPMNTHKECKTLNTVSVNDVTIVELKKVREELLDPARFTTTDEWFERFRTGFQAKLDEAAEVRIKFWAKRTGMVTALAPNGFVDSSASLYFSFAMITDLCRIYHLRAGRTGTAVLLGRVFFNSYLAGQLNEWEKLTEEQFNLLIAPHGPLYELTAAKVLSKVGAKATSGVLNYFLISRLGKFASRLLRPVS